jgi:hypothetical protein
MLATIRRLSERGRIGPFGTTVSCGPAASGRFSTSAGMRLHRLPRRRSQNIDVPGQVHGFNEERRCVEPSGRITSFGLNAIIAKVYKGPSWLDSKECIVLDYSETSLVAGWIRDEIRQIGPGLYLGKVYGGRKRLIDFALKF